MNRKTAIFFITISFIFSGLLNAVDLENISVKDLNLKLENIYVPSIETKTNNSTENLYTDNPLIPPYSFDKRIIKTIKIPGINNTLAYAVKFKQTAYNPTDLQSDVSLLIYTKAIPKVLFKVLFGIIENPTNPNAGAYTDENPIVKKSLLPDEEIIMTMNIPEEEKERLIIQLRNSKMIIEGRVNPLRVKQMIKMFTQIMHEEHLNGIKPKYGNPHTWSPEFIRLCKNKVEIIPLMFSKLLMALSSGVTSRHMHTGQEKALIKYILSKEDDSVTLDRLFRQSYLLNNGDVYLTILTNLNILSDSWRHPNRNNLAITKKLSVITNFYNGKGDKFGSWYHFHGIMLYGYVQGGFKSTIVGHVESAGSHILGEGDEQQEDYVNAKGGRIGGKLAKIVKKEKYLDFDAQGINYCDPEVYLNLTEDYRDRLEIINSKDFRTTLSFEILWLESLYKDYLNCKLEVMYNDFTGEVSSRNLIIRNNVSIYKGETYRIRINSAYPVEKARAFLTNCSNQSDQAMEDYDPSAEDKI